MKTISLLLILLLTYTTGSNAQTPETENPDQFLFSEFSVGIIKLKNGEKVALNLNYNLVTEKMVFYQGDQLFDVVNRSAIDTVYIQSRKFITANNVFYEVLVHGRLSLLAQNTGKVKAPPRPAAYDGTSEVSSSTYIDNMKFGGEVFRMKRDAPVVVIPEIIFWIKNDEILEPVTGKGKLLRIMEERKSEINTYLKDTELDIKQKDDMMKITAYFNSLAGERMP